MAERLASWVWIGAGALACVAGVVNVVGFLGFQHQAITHLTGNTTLLGAAMASGSPRAGMSLFGMIAAFVAGAMLSGLIVQDSVLRLGRRYGVVLALESGLLLLSVPMFERHSLFGPLCAAIACGLQNAMATTYSGAIVRTSHVSGMFTDLGIMLGHALRGLPVARRRLGLCIVVVAWFFAGSVIGAWLFAALGYAALYFPAALTGTAGVAYVAYRQFVRRHDGRPDVA